MCAYSLRDYLSVSTSLFAIVNEIHAIAPQPELHFIKSVQY